jgi:serine/threonine protein kinase
VLRVAPACWAKRARSRLDHPNIVSILDCGETTPQPPDFLWRDQRAAPDEVVYLAMRYVEDGDLTGDRGTATAPRSRRRLGDRSPADWKPRIAASCTATSSPRTSG